MVESEIVLCLSSLIVVGILCIAWEVYRVRKDEKKGF